MIRRAMKFVPALGVILALAAPTAAQAMTGAQRNAISSARDYLSYEAFSRSGLIQQLSSQYGEGYPKSVAIYAVNYLHPNWYKQAVKSARDYLSTQSFSRSGLIQQLDSPYGEGFTYAQAAYGVSVAYH